MVERWSKEISYDAYFAECAPQYCTYSVTERKSVILIVPLILGLLGGLKVALKILAPLLTQLAIWLVKYRRRT